ncbi:conserved rodent malaria protein, unknown function [Plasmodium berghei]|uniref:Fam-c protein n=2 Tax=Plasmodium berghei TaxID=5821 RepID=A0A509AG92_PLABA|nr:conserved rodent malaria protein, unknown function [Plasmodium berghei ANKA]CXI13525.1 conserved rodent malaria protein, unknown function [Plasmodium berghei]SBW38182.1 conserved rodent malaria protein, unknown function [Plasmodium berghei]SCL82174.1 conserved rodent malaria protein, unknown function [Plasmodium berghei]SCL82792.1 conserved rodent malaria protein, unknown function [Plasmodium berghei]SCL83055.1 conserved rodent malaria protein, unknown function [Plasmodium berghei]|eukprot:XP_034420486.1 conserved rodent malaria protein, unknown function [Plasmodium berghei ANKA]
MFPYFVLICIFLYFKNESFATSLENKTKNENKILLINDNPVKELTTEETILCPNEYEIKNQYNQNDDKNVSIFEEILTILCNHNYKLKITRKSKKLVKKVFRKLLIIKPYIPCLLKQKSDDECDYLEDDPEVIPYSKEIESEIDALKDNDREDNIDNQKKEIDSFFRKPYNPFEEYMEDNEYDNDDSYNHDDEDEDDKGIKKRKEMSLHHLLLKNIS